MTSWRHFFRYCRPIYIIDMIYDYIIFNYLIFKKICDDRKRGNWPWICFLTPFYPGTQPVDCGLYYKKAFRLGHWSNESGISSHSMSAITHINRSTTIGYVSPGFRETLILLWFCMSNATSYTLLFFSLLTVSTSCLHLFYVVFFNFTSDPPFSFFLISLKLLLQSIIWSGYMLAPLSLGPRNSRHDYNYLFPFDIGFILWYHKMDWK